MVSTLPSVPRRRFGPNLSGTSATAPPPPANWTVPPPAPKPTNADQQLGPGLASILKSMAPYMAPEKLAQIGEQFAVSAGRHHMQRSGYAPNMTGTSVAAPTVGDQRMTIREPVTAIGDVSQKPYFKVAEGGQPEQVQIGPAPGAQPIDGQPVSHPMMPQSAIAPALVGFADGGTVTVDPTTADYEAKKKTADAQQADITANKAAVAAAGGQLPYDRAALDATAKATAAQKAALAPQSQYIDAQGNSLNAQSTANDATRAYLAEQQRAADAMKGETQQVNAAENNTADTVAVAQAKQTRADAAYKYNAAGISQPQEVQTANGADQAGLPPGVVAKLETQGEVLTRQFAYSDKMRSFDIEAARIAAAQAGTNVTAADIAAGRVKLTADQAALAAKAAGLNADEATTAAKIHNMSVEEAKNNAAGTGLDVAQAQLDQQNASQPPAPGMVQWIDPSTGLGQWVTPEAKQQKQQAWDQAHPQQVGTYSTSDYGHLSTAGILAAMTQGSMTMQEVEDELVLRGYTKAEASTLIFGAYQTRSSAPNYGGGY